ncbi:MAG: patatin-like phospholipase family protein [Rhizobiales bacterium]|nr:patatin-like phospholipase family protein [Rhizobacter sp.]
MAFVLGSGGVRSIAAVGIADRLAREGIAPDLIVGCSSGALFGATLAVGMRSDQALRAATSLWSAELTQQRRWRAYLQLIAPRLAGFGASFAMRDDRLIAARIEQAFGTSLLEDMLTPLRVVATDAANGTPIVLTRGRLVQALRASMAVPFIFASVEVDGRALVDGVISDPLPLAAARDADVIVALGFQGDMPRRVDRASRLVARTSTALINNLMQARTDAARLSGQRVVHVDLNLDRRIGLWETDALPELVDAGRRAAEVILPELVALLNQGTGGAHQRKSRQVPA